MIAWKYLDKTAATVAAIRDYGSMKAIIDNTPEEVKAVYETMTAPRSSVPTGLPPALDPQAGQEKLTAQVDKLDVLRARYSAAAEYMAWFAPAWDMLTDMERHILREFYAGESCRSGACARLMISLNYSERHVERLRGRALRHLQLLLFG